MHVLIIPSFYPSSYHHYDGVFFQEHAQHLKKIGIKVGVIRPSYLKSGDVGNDLSKLCDRSPLWALHLLPFIGWLLSICITQFRYRRYVVRHGKPDVLHAQCMVPGGMAAFWLSMRYRIPYVLMEHYSMYYGAGLMNRLRWRTFVKPVITHAAKCLTVSQALRDRLEHYFPYSKGRWEIMPNMVDLGLFTPRDVYKNEREFCFLHVSFLRWVKAVDVLIRAFAMAFSGDEKMRLVIGGDGPDRARLEALVRELGVTSQVRFTGMLTREQVAQEMAMADAFVLSSRHETFGVVVIEALAMGKPVISTQCGGPQDSLRMEDGMLVPVGDVEAMSEAMRNMREHYARYDAQAISQACHARFDAEILASRYRLIYEAVAGSYS